MKDYTKQEIAYCKKRKYLGKSDKYRNVSKESMPDETIIYIADITRNKRRYSSYHYTERDAALAIDKYLITINEEPINILKKVKI